MEKVPEYYPITAYEEYIIEMNEVIKDKLYISGYQAAENKELILKN